MGPKLSQHDVCDGAGLDRRSALGVACIAPAVTANGIVSIYSRHEASELIAIIKWYPSGGGNLCFYLLYFAQSVVAVH